MTRAPIFAVIERRKRVGDIFRDVLSKHNLADAFDEREIQIRPKLIVENTGNQKQLSNAILNAMCYSAWGLTLDRRPRLTPVDAQQRIVSTN